uniref:Pro-resilin n=1 Tax=Timema cristinae TaxID=61476 RepID=A0A7R9CBZ0_TIMCR|nr:unnamed protein product [Timema cristinae]
MVFYQLLASALLATMATAGHQGGAEGFGSQYNGASNSYGTPTGGFGSGYDGHGGSGDFNDEVKKGFGNQINLYRDRGLNPLPPSQKSDTIPLDRQPKSYQFGYAVKDYASGNDYNRKESSDGNTVQGEYRVLLPDGRTQIVTYIADWQNGFRANVRYEGEAHYPEPVNSGYGTGASQSGGGNFGQGNSGSSGHGQLGSSFSGHGGSNFGSSHSGGFESQSGSLGVSSTYGPPSYHK